MKEERFVFEHVAISALQKVLNLNERINWRSTLKRGTFNDVMFV